ncbi:hypothetical protein ACPYIY_32820, partial [Burkholderia pseudomallei]
QRSAQGGPIPASLRSVATTHASLLEVDAALHERRRLLSYVRRNRYRSRRPLSGSNRKILSGFARTDVTVPGWSADRPLQITQHRSPATAPNSSVDAPVGSTTSTKNGMPSGPQVGQMLRIARDSTLSESYYDDFYCAVSVDEKDIGAAYARSNSKLVTTE